MLTTKQIAITRLVDARMKGFQSIALMRSSLASVVYLKAYGQSNPSLVYIPLYSFNICALKKDPLVPFLKKEFGSGFLGFNDGIPIRYGPELVDKYFHFLTYNQ